MISIIAGAANLLGSAIGGISAIKQAKKQEAILDEREDEIEDWYKQEINTDILDTSSSKSVLAQQRKQNDQQMSKMSNNAIRRGLTSEAQVAMASNINENYADAMTKIAASGDERANSLRSTYSSEMSRIADMRSQLSSAKSSAIGAFANNLGSVTNSILQSEALFGDKALSTGTSGSK